MGGHPFRVILAVSVRHPCKNEIKFQVEYAHISNHILDSTSRIRQYPLYSKKEPPAALAKHFDAGVFEKSQKYGKDKAKFAFFSGIFKQLLDSTMLHYGFYAWSWTAAGKLTAKVGYGPEYEVCTSYSSYLLDNCTEHVQLDSAIYCFCLPSLSLVYPPHPSSSSLWHLCPRRKARFQQDYSRFVRCRPFERMGNRICLGRTVPCGFLVHFPMGWRSFCSMVNGLHVSLSPEFGT